jgi:DNA-binding NtrC family response regulator
MEQRRLSLEVETLRRQLQDKQSLESRLIGRSPAMEKVRRMIADLADTSANVLILGETGTGKELVARCLHEISRRQKHNFVAVNWWSGGKPVRERNFRPRGPRLYRRGQAPYRPHRICQ